MTFIVVQSNITAVLAWVVFVGIGALMCLEGFSSMLYTAIVRKIPFDKFRNEECGWLFWISWLTACFLFSLLGSLFVWDLYTVSYQSDAAPFIFGALLFYLLAIRGWLWAYYTMRWSAAASYALLGFAFISGLIVLGLAFLTISDHPWHHYFSVVLLVPPITACFSVYHCEKGCRAPTQAIIINTTEQQSVTAATTFIARSPPPQQTNFRPQQSVNQQQFVNQQQQPSLTTQRVVDASMFPYH